MLGSKKFEKTILRLTIIVLIFSLVVVCFPNMFSLVAREDAGEDYPVALFGRDVINIEISVDENEWNEMIANKMSKPYIACNMTIDGREFTDVGLRPKGNSSLASSGEKVSYRLDFDHYIDNQTCYGLEQMVLNNLLADATYMKDYIAYDLMAYQGVKAPLHTYAFITLNGEPYGVYLAVEVYDEDYLERTFDDTGVMLYSVKNSDLDEFENAIVDSEKGTVIESLGMVEASGMGGPGGPPPMPPMGGPGGQMPMPPMGGPGGQMPDGGMMPMPPSEEQPSEEWMPEPPAEEQAPAEGMPMPPMGGPGGQMPEGGKPPMGGFGSSGGGLVYTDDSTNSYSTIFGNAVSKYADAEDFARVIKAIKYLNKENVTNEELEKYWDVDGTLRYFAVHTFMVNNDSYTGGMQQNYYLAEQDGRVTILPWDYNLSFGSGPGGGPGGGPPGMPGSNSEMSANVNEATQIVNHAIDTPVFGGDMESRPLLSVLLSREEYKAKYHQYLDELTRYASGDFINKLEILESSIYPYIEKETIAFYTPEEHKTAFDVLKTFIDLRCQSIQGQLRGDIPSETDKQNGAELIYADFSTGTMGSMGGPGGGPPGMGGEGGMMPPPPGMGGEDGMMPPPPGMGGEGGMMPPPPPGMGGEGGMMPPPPPGMGGEGGMMPPPFPGMEQSADNTGFLISSIIALAILSIVFIGAKLFRRYY